MPKAAVIHFDPGERVGRIFLKRLALLFDKIYVNDYLWHLLQMDAEYLEDEYKEEKQMYVRDMDWLLREGVINTYKLDRTEEKGLNDDKQLAKDIRVVNKTIEENIIWDKEFKRSRKLGKRPSGKLEFAGVLRMTNEMKCDIEDIKARNDAARLSLSGDLTQFIPVLHSFHSYQGIEAADWVADFTLNKMPVPADNVSWEQLMDFRSDEDVKRKYYALINWVNEMATSSMPLAHIADKYNQLYSEYTRQYTLHKLASGFTTIELMISGGMDFIASLTQGQFIGAFKNLVSIRKQQVGLMQAEQNISGRELAYIHTANEKFGGTPMSF